MRVQWPPSASSTRVVDDLPEAVHETAAVGGPDVHPGPLTDGLESFEHRQVPGRVPVLIIRRDGGCDGGQRRVLLGRS